MDLQVKVAKYVLVAALYAGATTAIVAADFGPGDGVIVTVLVIGVQVVFGVTIGRWWAVLLPWLAIISAPFAYDPDYGTGTEILIAALAYAPSAAIVIAVVVALRRAVDRRGYPRSSEAVRSTRRTGNEKQDDRTDAA